MSFVTFEEEESYILASEFMDLYCISDNMLWVNLESFILKKSELFTPIGLIKILGHFSS
jgi:hypothetical protein